MFRFYEAAVRDPTHRPSTDVYGDRVGDVGQRISAGSTLLSLEAMKMETHFTADRDAEVEAVHIVPGHRVLAKDLLIVLQAPA